MKHLLVEGIESKECTKCHKILPLDSFSLDKSKKDGFYSSCKECCAKKDQEIYRRNPKKKYEMVKAYMKRTGLFNEYHAYNPDYYSSPKSKEKKKIRDKKRRTLEKKANEQIKITQDVIQILKRNSDGKCEYCGADCSEKYQIDHKIPLFRGGTNEINNLAFCCPQCNWSKGKKTAEEFMLSKQKIGG